jgi:hypothetical protein
MAQRRNPYRTAPGSEPPELSGRAGELGAAHYAIDMTRERAPANPIVFTGLRGMGKTALLRRVARDAAAVGGISIVGEADASLRFGDVMRRELSDALKRTEPLPARLSTSIARIIEKLPKLSYEMPHQAGSIGIAGRGDGEEDDLHAANSLEDVLLLLNEQLHRHGRFLVIGLDEIQESSRVDLLRIVRAVHKTAGTDSPILFVGAGLPDSPAVLKGVRTYTERWAYYRLELLTPEATREAIDKPARELGTRWTHDALRHVYDMSRGYPYFLQAFASAAWLRHTGDTVRADDVVAIAPGVQRMLDESVYDRQFVAVSPREAAVVLALHTLGPGAHRLEEIAGALNLESSADLGSVRSQLLKKDIIYAPARGLAEFRLPLTVEYIDRHIDALRKRARLAQSFQ